jgi:hypothetical protein
MAMERLKFRCIGPVERIGVVEMDENDLGVCFLS